MYRRECLKTLRDAALVGGAAGLPTAWAWAREQEQRPGIGLDPTRPYDLPLLHLEHLPDENERNAMAAIARKFTSDYSVPGLSVAFARHGQVVYAAGFGVANRTTGEDVAARHRFRIASVTKPITSVALFTLIEEGRLHLGDKPFARADLLESLGPRLELLPNPNRVKVREITIHDLMTHTGGGWQNDGNDPMFRHPEMNHAELIEWTTRNQPLEYTPGAHYAYSNFGYCILGRVIEKLTGESYEAYVKRAVLARCGVTSMEIASNVTPKANEVSYYDADPRAPYSMNVARMDSHGGWIATPTDLVRFANHVDGLSAKRNILQPATFATMTTPTAANKNYACGWSVNAAPNWWHNGSLPGTSSIMVRTASGLCWAGITNWRSAPGIDLALDQMLWKMAKAVPAWQA